VWECVGVSESECVGVWVWECVGVWEGECVGVWETGEDTRGVGRGDCNWRVSAQPVVRPHADTTPVETGLCTRQTLLRVVDTLKVEFRNPALHAPNPPARVQKHTPSVHKSSLNAISAVLCGPWRLGGESFLRPPSSLTMQGLHVSAAKQGLMPGHHPISPLELVDRSERRPPERAPSRSGA